jgi:hypothetical protein
MFFLQSFVYQVGTLKGFFVMLFDLITFALLRHETCFRF